MTPEKRRTLMFSATMPPAIVRLAERYQANALRLSLAGQDRGHGDISYQAITVAPSEIENAVVNLLRFHEAETAICFCATRDSVRRLHATLQNRGFGVVALSGEHSQSERNQALQAMRDRRARVSRGRHFADQGHREVLVSDIGNRPVDEYDHTPQAGLCLRHVRGHLEGGPVEGGIGIGLDQAVAEVLHE